MSKFLSLTKVLFKTGTNSLSQDKKKKTKTVFLYAIILIAFIPFAISIGDFTGKAYDALVLIDQEGTLLSLAYTVTSMLILLFGVMYVLSIYYFSKDIDNLLPLPLKPREIIAAKFLVTLAYEYILEVIFLLPVIICYGIKSNGNVLYYIYSLIIFLTIPIIPLIISSILSMILMRFSNIGKNKDRFKVISSVLLAIFIFAFNMYTSRLTSQNTSTSQLQNMLSEGNNSLISTVTSIFVNAKLASLSVTNVESLKGLANMLIYLFLTAALFIVFLILAQGLYFKGVIGLNQTATKKRKLSADEFEKGVTSNGITKALFLNEIKSLFRTPIYFINCILMNFLLPVFLLLPMVIQTGGKNGLQGIRDFVAKGGNYGAALSFVFLASVFITSSNAIASTTISREGQNLFFLKYIPVNYIKQINAKILTGIVVGFVGTLLMIITGGLLFKVKAFLIFMSVLVSIVGIVLSSETGMILDLYFPKLVWDNEQKAVKQNLNVIFNMLLGLVISGLLVYLSMKFDLSLINVFLVITLFYGVLDYILYIALIKIGAKQLKSLLN